MDRPHWTIELDVRADAPRMFVPRADLPDAQTGDRVQVSSSRPPATVDATVVDEGLDPTTGPYVVLSFEEEPS